MGLKSKLGCLVVFCCASALSFADMIVNHDENIHQLLEKSGLTGLSYQARHIAQQAMNDTAAPLNKQYEVVEAIAPLWGVKRIEEIVTNIAEQMTSQQQQTLLQIFDSPVLLQAREKELEALAEQGSASYKSYAQQLRQEPPAEARLAMIAQLDKAMHFSVLLQRTRLSVYSELEQTLPQWETPADWQQTLEQQALEFLFYVHRTTPNSTLKRLVQSYQTPQMQQWLQQIEQQLPATKASVAAVE